MKRVTIILIAVCIAFFVGLTLQGLQFMNAPIIEENTSNMEGFKAVTRATDCNCLPGYIPSKDKDAYICQNLQDPKKKRKCY
jgi:hypothetical protein